VFVVQLNVLQLSYKTIDLSASTAKQHALMHSPSTPSTPSHSSWKSVFRLQSISKKHRVNGSVPPVERSPRTVSSPPHTVKHPTPMPSLSLTPGSFHPIDERSSYNSSNTQSSDSNVGAHNHTLRILFLTTGSFLTSFKTIYSNRRMSRQREWPPHNTPKVAPGQSRRNSA